MSGKSIAALRRRRGGNSKHRRLISGITTISGSRCVISDAMHLPSSSRVRYVIEGSSSFAHCGDKRKRQEIGFNIQWLLHPFDAPPLILAVDTHTSLDDIIIVIQGQDGSKVAVRVNKAWPTSLVLNVFSKAISRSHHTSKKNVRFLIDGDNVHDSSTFSKLGVENGGIISWVLGQHGGSKHLDALLPCERKRKFFLTMVDLYHGALELRDEIDLELGKLEADKEKELDKVPSQVEKEAEAMFDPLYKRTDAVWKNKKATLEEEMEIQRALENIAPDVNKSPPADGESAYADAMKELEKDSSAARWNVTMKKEQYIKCECENKRRRVSDKFHPDISALQAERRDYTDTMNAQRLRITRHLGNEKLDFDKTVAALQRQLSQDGKVATVSPIKEPRRGENDGQGVGNMNQSQSEMSDLTKAAGEPNGAAEEEQESQEQSQDLLAATEPQMGGGLDSQQDVPPPVRRSFENYKPLPPFDSKRTCVRPTRPSNKDIEDYAFEIGSNYKGNLTYNGLYHRKGRNMMQRAAHTAFRNQSKKAYRLVLNNGGALDPVSPLFRFVKRGHEEWSLNNKRSHIYLEEDIEENGDGDKGGQAGVGEVRLFEYEKLYSLGKEVNYAPEITSIIDIDNMPSTLQPKVTELCIEIAEMFMCEEQPKTLYDLVALEMTGLPVAVQSTLEYIVKGGAYPVNGYLVKLVRNVLETGSQTSWSDRGLVMNESTSSDEYIDSRVLDRFFSGDMEVLQNVDECCDKIFTHPDEIEFVKQNVIKIRRIFLAWAPGRLPSCPPKFEEAKPIIAKKVAGDDVEIVDPIKGWPKERPENFKECHDSSLYEIDNIKNGKTLTIAELRLVGKEGGIAAFDECKLIWGEDGGLVSFMTDELESPLGIDGPKWCVVHTTIGIVILKIEWVGDGRIRVVIVFVPWCNMIFSKDDVPRTWKSLQSSEKASKSAHWVQNFLRILEAPNLDELVTDKSLNRLVGDNIYLAFMMYVHSVKFWRLPPKTASLECKHRMLDGRLNAFHHDFTNMLRTAGFLELFGSTVRSTLSTRTDEEEKVERDNKFRRGAIQYATNSSSIEEALQRLMHAIQYDVLGDGKKLNASRAGKRFVILTDTATTKMLFQSIQTKLHNLWKFSRPNPGNNLTHRASTNDEMDEADMKLLEFSESGEPFIVQVYGKAGTEVYINQNKKGGKRPFVYPEEGASLGTYEVKGVMSEIFFYRSKFVQLVYSSLIGRVRKKMNGAGLTNRKTVKRFGNKTIRFATGMMEMATDTRGRKESVMVGKWNMDHHLVCVWFVDKK